MAPTTVPKGTIRTLLAWVAGDPDRARQALEVEVEGRNRKGLVEALEQLLAEAKAADPATKKIELGQGLLLDALELREQMFAASIEQRAMVVSDGPTGSHVEIVEIFRSQPTFQEKKTIAQAITILATKAVELMGDEATQGGGVLHDLGAERAARRSAAAETAAAPGERR